MIKQLRKKVFLSIFASAFGVVFLIVVAINLANASAIYARATETMAEASRMFLSDGRKRGDRPPRGPGGGRFDLMQSVSAGDLIILELDENGEITAASDPDTAEGLSDIVSSAYHGGKTEGIKKAWMYAITEDARGTYLTLLNTKPLLREFLERAFGTLIALCGAFGLIGAVANLLAERIVAPVEQTMTAQKRFIADASHELKTPLTVIDANAAVLEKETGASKWLDYIKEQTSRMSALVTALLDLSRIEEEPDGVRNASAETFDASEVLMESVLPFESAAFERGMSLQTDAPENLTVSGHAGDLRQIIGILLDNALKHAKQGSEITLSLKKGVMKRNGKETSAIVLTAANTGETIPADALPHLFERFYRADASRTHTGNSFGLGLSIARALAEKHRGTITVSSENSLTVFTVTLPFTWENTD